MTGVPSLRSLILIVQTNMSSLTTFDDSCSYIFFPLSIFGAHHHQSSHNTPGHSALVMLG